MAQLKNKLEAFASHRLEEKDKEGFTLIELIIVIAIIGILVAIAIPVYANLMEDSKQAVVERAAKNAADAGSVWLATPADQREGTLNEVVESMDTNKISITMAVSLTPGAYEVTATWRENELITSTKLAYYE